MCTLKYTYLPSNAYTYMFLSSIYCIYKSIVKFIILKYLTQDSTKILWSKKGFHLQYIDVMRLFKSGSRIQRVQRMTR